MPASPSQLRTIVVSRQDIESGNLQPTLATLRALIRDAEAANASRGRVDLDFPGWWGSPLYFWEIPEVRSFLRRLDAEFPHLFWVLPPGPPMAMLAMCCCEPRSGTAILEINELKEFILTRCGAVMGLAEDLGLRMPDALESVDAAALYFAEIFPALEVRLQTGM